MGQAEVSTLLPLCTALHVAALMAWFGALSLRRLLGAGQGGGELRFLRSAAALALASGALWPWLEAASLADDAATAWDPAQLALVLTQTRFGQVWLAREAIIALATFASMAPLLAIGRANYFLVVAALASMALVGHAAAGDDAAAHALRLTQAAHLLAAGAWVGALPALWVLAGRLAAADLAKVLQRFSRYGIALVAVVLVTGTIIGWVRTGALTALLHQAYGQTLLAKVALVALMGCAALANRNRYLPWLRQRDVVMQAAGRAGLRRSIAVELTLGMAVIAVAVVLGQTEPPG